MQVDVIIIGAGPAGNTAAILLARYGWKVALVEREAFPRRKVCGECISASNIPALRSLGVWEDLSRLAGPPLQHLALVVRHTLIRARMPPYRNGSCPWGVAVGREHLDALLLNQARRAGVEVLQPYVASALNGTPGNYRCRLREVAGLKTLEIQAPLAIIASGTRSLSPQPDHKRAVRKPSDLLAFKANYTRTRLEPGLLPVLSFPGGYGGVVVAGQDIATFAFCLRRDVLQGCRAGYRRASISEAAAAYVLDHSPALRSLFAGASICGGDWIGAGPLRPGIHLDGTVGGPFRIGNAAGEAHPIVGEGISMAIQSAWLLGSMLGPGLLRVRDAEWQHGVQKRYAHEWRIHFAPRIRMAAAFAHAAMRPTLWTAAEPLLRRYPRLLERFACWAGKVEPAPHQPRTESALLDINVTEAGRTIVNGSGDCHGKDYR